MKNPKFNIDEVVCLSFDETKRFLVVNNCIGDSKVEVAYFNPFVGEISHIKIEERYLQPLEENIPLQVD